MIRLKSEAMIIGADGRGPVNFGPGVSFGGFMEIAIFNVRAHNHPDRLVNVELLTCPGRLGPGNGHPQSVSARKNFQFECNADMGPPSDRYPETPYSFQIHVIRKAFQAIIADFPGVILIHDPNAAAGQHDPTRHRDCRI